MKQKLKVFSSFAAGLLPHETEYLLGLQQFQDDLKLSILHRLHEHAREVTEGLPFDESINKRKYSNLKGWIERKLTDIDVDHHYDHLCRLETHIMNDRIDPADEKWLLQAISGYQHPSFYFCKFYRVIRLYRHFLLIRMRHGDHEVADKFLKHYEEAFMQSSRIDSQLHEATRDIVEKYSANSRESIQWKKWLEDLFFDENTDGYHRYMAMVRLIFIRFSYHEHDQLASVFTEADKWFSQGKAYSRRILLNYYSNRLLFHASRQEWEEAVYYGKLSIRGTTNDTLLYVNNLVNVLLRRDRFEEAWEILRQSLDFHKNSNNFHSRIGFVSLYAKTLLKKGQPDKAQSYMELYLRGYEKEVKLYRWHRFFATYLETLLAQKNYKDMLRVVRRYKLVQRELEYQSRSDYLPAIQWLKAIAEYHAGLLEASEVNAFIQRHLQRVQTDQNSLLIARHLIQDLSRYEAELLRETQVMNSI